MINQSAEYALRVVVRIADVPVGEWASAADLARELRMPSNYLSKLLNELADAGVLISRRGRSGGFRLARPAAQLSLADVVNTFDPIARFRECLLGGARCSAETACEAHAHWKPVAEATLGFLSQTTVDQLAGKRVPRPRTGNKRRSRAT